ncbi:translation initiation factor IF-2 [Albimonas sp. CAU 1670]|uniref:translation initiation factor IF-2 n=1 Tax=Albimonas sp. CAU 1670 TaxID=3032599 RepID=UPI0023DC55DE|nr:translation initiation factor IF-2 [Albimonas sp. CAU 1670]MDF2231402.1 translation initiation factor IF-2 [Albimonas sp. CAU 1670]
MDDRMDGNDKSGGMKTRSRPGGEGPGRVRQSFSHGRTKSVVVETKRSKKLMKPGEGAPAAPAPASPASSGASAPRPSVAPGPRGVAARPAGAGVRPTGGAEAPAAAAAQRAAGAGADSKPQRRQGKGNVLKSLSPEEYERRKKALEAAKQNEGARRAKEEAEAKEREAERQRLLKEKEERERKEAEEQIRREREEAERLAAEEEARKKAEADKKERERAKAEREAARIAAPDPASAPPAEGEGKDRPMRGVPPRRAAPADDKKPGRGRGGDERRRSGKLTISSATSGDEGGRQRSLAAMRRKQERQKRQMGGRGVEREKVTRDVNVPDAITVQELANRMAERAADVVKMLFKSGMMVTINDTLDADTATLVVEEFGHNVVRVSDSDVEQAIDTVEDAEGDLQPRAPVVTIMGHVDHGKTSLLDALRKTNVVQGEAGGITQHIGAYQITTDSGAPVTFLDTPGHAAFTSMRARGAQVTDIVILVVAADDAVMPQTIEAIHHAKAANVPIIVAINKCDKPDANPQKVRTDLLQHEIVVEEMSGDVQDVEVSAKTGKGLDTLLEAIALQAEILELKANPERQAEGAVIEAKLDTGRGPVATVLVQRGTLKRGDIFVVGEQWGRVRALINDQGERVDEAGPSVPVEVLGLQGTPAAGDVLNVVESEGKAREIADYRQRQARDKQAAAGARGTLDQLLAQVKADANVAELPVLVKADVQGSAEAIVQALEKIGNEDVRVRVVHSGVGAITETDVGLAEASNMPVIGFNVRANAPAREAANQKGVEIRYYSVIYDLVDDVKLAAQGLLKPEVRETFIGYAKIKEVFKVTGVGKVAGCEVTEGVARKSAGVRLLRDDVVIHEGTLKTLKRFKDEVNEVRSGQECGMAFQNYEDIREGDVIEIFTTQEVERTL